MSTLAHPLRDRLSLARVAVHADVLALAGLAFVIAVLLPLTWATWGDPARDTGYDAVAGARVANGELPYADFVYYYGPLAPAVLGLAALVGGDGLQPGVLVGLCLALAIVGATYAVGRRLAGPLGAFLAAAITAAVAFAPTNLSFVQPHTYSAPLAVLGALVFLLAAGRYADRGERLWGLGAGVAAGLVGLTRPEFALAALVAAGLWIGLRESTRRRDLLLVGIPALGIPVVVYGALAIVAGPGTLVFDNLYPVDTLREGGNAVLRIHAPLTAGSFAEVGGRLALYAIGVGVLVLAGRLLSRRPVQLAAAVGVLGVAAAALARPEAVRHGLQFAYGWIPAGALLAAVYLVARRRRGGPWTPVAQVELLTTVVLAVLSLKIYASFLLHAPRAQPAAYAAPFAALLLARLHLVALARSRGALALGALWLAFLAAAGVGLTLKDARTESRTLHGPGGTLAVTPEDAAAYGPAVDWITSNTEPGEAILVAPQATWLYPLTGRVNPLPEISLLPGALPDAASEQAVIAALERTGIRVAILARRRFTEYGHTSFGLSFDRMVGDWVERNFTRVATPGVGVPDANKVDIWLRRES